MDKGSRLEVKGERLEVKGERLIKGKSKAKGFREKATVRYATQNPYEFNIQNLKLPCRPPPFDLILLIFLPSQLLIFYLLALRPPTSDL